MKECGVPPVSGLNRGSKVWPAVCAEQSLQTAPMQGPLFSGVPAAIWCVAMVILVSISVAAELYTLSASLGL